MKARMAVVDWSGNYEENCIQLGKHLGRDKLRRELFGAIYGRGSKPRTKKELMAATGLKAAKSQQAQNQLDILYRYGLVLRDDNDSVPDRSRYVYSKEPHVRAHRDKIVKHADNPKLAKTTPTKRNPVMRNKVVIQRMVITKQALKKHKKIDVLYLMANACKSAGARAALLGTAKAIVVMQDEISDVAAVAFAAKFYGGIASGQSLQSAFDQGRVAVEAVSMGEAATPVLITAKGVNPRKLILA